jgi:arsenite methyltransferase
VLDVGCGRGLLLIGAAKRLTTGKAVGVDIWQTEDLSGNRPEATLENARLERVAERVEVKDGDARRLPFADGTFDVIVTKEALHNIYNASERDTAVREIARVLRPGGRLFIGDVRHTGRYIQVLRECGLEDLRRSAESVSSLLLGAISLGFVYPAHVTARKPAPSGGR